MRDRNRLLLGAFLVTVVCLILQPWAFGASREIRQADQMSGTIIAPLEERKQALSAGDKVFIALDKNRTVKKGDLLEIYQPVPLVLDGKPLFNYARAGEVIVLEPVNDRLLLGVIESSNKEIAVGDRIFFPERP